MMACFDNVSAQPLERGLEKSPYIRRTLASPIFAISSNSPSTILAEALSASIRTAGCGKRGSVGMTYPQEWTMMKAEILRDGEAIGSTNNRRFRGIAGLVRRRTVE